MLKKDLAEQLGISPSMVSRLAKRGMPTDSFERAERWRRRHLEPAMIKGERAGTTRTIKEPVSTSTPSPSARVAPAAAAPSVDTPAVRIGALATQANAALLVGAPEGVAVHALRQALRPMVAAGPLFIPALPARVWLALMGYYLADDHPLRVAAPDAPLSFAEALLGRDADLRLVLGCDALMDSDDVALHGWGLDDEPDPQDGEAVL